nr:amidohydrolase family protein [Pseudanabaena sp. PCC 6802]
MTKKQPLFGLCSCCNPAIARLAQTFLSRRQFMLLGAGAFAAYQHFEEDRKGSVEVGKLADFAILSDNPLTVDPMAIKDITVLATIKEGKTIYKA